MFQQWILESGVSPKYVGSLESAARPVTSGFIASVWKGLKAAVVPTKSVLLVTAYEKNPYLYFNVKNIRELKLPIEDFIHLIEFFNSSMAIDSETSQPVVVLRYSDRSCFYLSDEKYHVFKTCNVWTAKALKESGLGVVPVWAITSGNIMRQVRRTGKTLMKAYNVLQYGMKRFASDSLS